MKILKPYIRFGLSILLFFLSLSVLAAFSVSVFHVDLQDPNIVYVLQLVSNVFIALCLFLLYRKDLLRDWKKFKENFWDISDIALKYWFIGLMVMAVSNLLIGFLTPSTLANNEQDVRNVISEIPILAFFLTTFFAPFNEEMVFRKSFREVIHSKFAYILTSGIIFGLLHVISSSGQWYDYLYIIPYSALGISFAAIYYKTDTIFSSIFVHALHNGILTLSSIVSGILAGLGMIL